MIPLRDNYFWCGTVESVLDPEQQGQIQVRIVGIHTPNKEELPTEDLPWIPVAMPITSAFISGYGSAPVGLVTGSTVAGIFLDDSFQEPLALFSFGGKQQSFLSRIFGFNDPQELLPLVDYGNDVNRLARGEVSKIDPTGNMSENRTENVPVAESKPEAPAEQIPGGTPWMPIALKEVGVTEEKNAARVREYHKLGSGINTSEQTAWCSSFVNFCMKQAKMPATNSAMARSWTSYGVAVSVDKIPYGAIVVLRGTRGPSSGHVVFCYKDNGDGTFMALGGNQTTSEGKRYDTGGAVTITKFKKEKVVATRMPK